METFQSIFDKKIIENLIPQKHPFVMVDKLYSFSESTMVSGLTISEDNIFFDGHHFIESGLIEHMAQSIALHKGYDCFQKNKVVPVGFIASLNNIEFFELPKLHDEIKTTVSILFEFGGMTSVEAITTINDKIIAKGELKTILAEMN
jgi:predicted hotdog family 3-hydroxylacyl-ACP dehydratase